ncbi:hypothetical protein [Christiangramia sp.]|uniref:hypothetical protein n=1 Tax=Christiangramia sp. TaxID=1931228 RepID=UPI002617A60A|nr:hypothetical protein [Christiangramia sp.]
MNIGIVDSELGFRYRLFCKTNSSSADWGFDRFRLFYPKWHTKVQVRRPDGSILGTKLFNTQDSFEHDFSFNLSENTGNEEYSVYIAGVPEGQDFNQLYAWPSGFSASFGRDADLTYLDLTYVNIKFSTTTGRIRAQNQPLTKLITPSLLDCAEVRFPNCQLGAEDLADLIIAIHASGINGGILDYSNNLAAPAGRCLTQFNDLKDVNTRNWAVTGATPSAYDADYQAVLDYASANAIPLPSTAESDANNQKVLDLKANGAWAKMDCFFKFKGSADPSFKLIDWKRVSQVSGFGSLTWNTTGVKGNGTNAYINSAYNPSVGTWNYQLNNAGIYCLPTTNNQETTTFFGAFDGINRTNVIANRGNTVFIRLNVNTADGQGPNANQQLVNTINGMDRAVSTEYTWRYGGSTQLQSYASSAIPNAELGILAEINSSDSSVSLYSTNELAYWFAGSSMSGEFAGLRTILE